MTIYQRHITSKKWQRFKRRVKLSRGECCERCGAASVGLEVHHVTYERLGNELPSDVLVLCHRCHLEADAARRSA